MSLLVAEKGEKRTNVVIRQLTEGAQARWEHLEASEDALLQELDGEGLEALIGGGRDVQREDIIAAGGGGAAAGLLERMIPAAGEAAGEGGEGGVVTADLFRQYVLDFTVTAGVDQAAKLIRKILRGGGGLRQQQHGPPMEGELTVLTGEEKAVGGEARAKGMVQNLCLGARGMLPVHI